MAALVRPVRAPPTEAKRRTPIVQPKLEVGPVGDRFEREADRIADGATRARVPPASAPPPVIAGIVAQRLPAAPVQRGPEWDTEEQAPPEQRAQRRATTSPAGAAGGEAPPGVDGALARLRGQPAVALDPALRARLEPRLGADLGEVRLHTGSTAAAAAEWIGARAFTVGRDIVFGRGEYRPTTTEGQRLIAHEAVHTVQQQGGSARARRTNGDPVADPGQVFRASPVSLGSIELTRDRVGGVLKIPRLQVPTMLGETKGASNHPVAPGRAGDGKSAITPGTPFVFTGRSTRGSTTARQLWLREAQAKVTPALSATVMEQKVRGWTEGFEFRPQGAGAGVPARRYLRQAQRQASNSSFVVPGTVQEFAAHELIRLPTWDRRGNLAFMDVDHAHELQLGGLDGWENFWLLDQSANRSAGSLIAHRMRTKLDGLLTAARGADFWTGPNAGRAPDSDQLRQGRPGWSVEFAGFAGLTISWPNRRAYWTRGEIMAGDHLAHVQAMTEPELVAEGLIYRAGGTPTRVSIFTDPEGGFRRRMRIEGDRMVPTHREGFYSGFNLLEATYRTPASGAGGEPIGHLNGRVFNSRPMQVQPIDLVVIHDPRFGFGGHVDRAQLRTAIRALRTAIKGASPVQFTEAGIDAAGVLYADGQITATKALFPNLAIPVHMRGTDLFVSFPIPTERLSFGPLAVTEASLDVGVGEEGVFLEGAATIVVEQVGQGRMVARVDAGNTVIDGTFDLDLDFLDPARLQVRYDLGADTLSGSATLGVPSGRLPGVDSGTVTVTMSREEVGVEGSLQLGGVLRGSTIEVSYDSTRGLLLGAEDIPLPVARLPGVSNATLNVRAVRDPDGTWTVSGEGTASLAAAGATGTLAIAYDGGAVTATGRAVVARGPASGWLQVTATNRQLDDAGDPVEDGGLGDLSIFGRGEATIAFGRFLTGTAGLEYTADGRTIVTGTIEVQPQPLFPLQGYERELLRLRPPEFPIWGVSVAGIGIGIFAFVDAVVRFEARVGPGELRDTFVTAVIDLDRPQEATVEGNARFYVPAYTGLTLDLGGGLRARIAIAYVQGRVGLDGTLGIDADASAAVNVRWNPTDGFALATEVEATARPKFRVGVNASVSAGVDLRVRRVEKTWGPWRRTLGEFGPDMELGVAFPVAWSEREGLDLSLDNMPVRRPQLDAAGIMGDAFDRLV
jgi:hypothetical protein